MRTGARFALSAGVAVGVVVLLFVLALVFLTQTRWGRDRIHRIALEQLQAAAEGTVRLGAIEGDLLTRVRLVDVSILDAEGRPFLQAESIATGYSLRGLLRRRLILQGLRLVRPVVVLDKPPGEEWNFVRIFPPGEPEAEPDPRDWGRWLEFRDVSIVEGRVTIRTEWQPERDLTPEERERAIEKALAGETRENIERVPGGFQNVMDFRQLDAELPLVRLAHPDHQSIPIEVARFRGIAQPFEPPAAVVRDLAGTFRLAQDTLHFEDVRARLPGSVIAGGGLYALDSGDLLMELASDSVTLADLRWLYPALPAAARGSIRLTVHRRTVVTSLLAREMDLHVDGSTARGQLGLMVGDTFRIFDTDLVLGDFDTRLLDQLIPPLEMPRHGRLDGRARVEGAAEVLRVETDLAFREPETGTSRLLARGEVGMGESVQFRQLELRFAPLQVALVRDFLQPLPARGEVTGDLRLNGALAGPLEVDGDLRLADPRTGVSRVLADGRLALEDELSFTDFRLRLQPLQAALLRDYAPDLPARGQLSGELRLTGSPARALDLSGDLRLADPVTGVSRVAAAGGVVFGSAPTFRDLRLRFLPLQLALFAEAGTELPLQGAISGLARLNGPMTGPLRVSSDLDIHDAHGGTSRISAEGELGLTDELRFRGLELRFEPLQVALLENAFSDLPVAGTLSGRATLTGGTASRIALDLSLVHRDRGETSQVSGLARLPMDDFGELELDVSLQPVSLTTLGRFAPGAGLQGSAHGSLRARGTPGDLSVAADLRMADGGRLMAEGWLDLASSQPRYDLLTRMEALDLAAVSTRAPETSLTGLLDARGSGVEPASMQAEVRADLTGPRLERRQADTVRLNLRLADGLATVDTATVRLAYGEIDAQGSFGLVETRSGQLRYRIELDSLAGLTRLPAPTDTLPTAEITVREVTVGQPIEAAQVEAVRPADERDVAMDTTTAPAPRPTRQPPAGRLSAAGTIAGNLARFDVHGQAIAERLVLEENAVERGRAQFALVGIGSQAPEIHAEADLAGVGVGGLTMDSVAARVDFRGQRHGTGDVLLYVRQDDETDYRLDANVSLALERNEVQIRELTLRQDTVDWRAIRPGAVSWNGDGIEVRDIDLRSDSGGRIALDGRLPVEGEGDLELVVHDLEIAQLLSLLQQERDAAGRLFLEARVRGTERNPRFDGALELREGRHDGTEIPHTVTTFAYDDRVLTAEGRLTQDGRPVAQVDATVPLDLGLGDRTGPRLLEAPLQVDVRADSLPLDALFAFTEAVDQVQGALVGTIAVRGTPADARLEGRAEVRDGALRITPMGVRYEDVSGALRLEDRTVVVDSVVGWSDGRLRITGGLDLSTLAAPAFDLDVEARDVWVMRNEHGRLQVDADLTIQGPFDAVRLEGEAFARRGVIYLPELGADRQVVGLDQVERTERVDTTLLAEFREAAAPSPILQNLEAEVTLRIDRDVWVRSTEANVEVYTPPEVGPLTVRMNGGPSTLSLEGTVNTDRGEYSFLSRRFVLTRGAATFLGGEEINPILQVAAEHEVRIPGRENLRIRVVLGGTLRDLEITLESSAQPPISQTDLLSYLAFGRSASSLLPQEGSGLSGAGSGSGDLVGNVAGLATQQLAAVAVGTLVDEFESEAARSLGLDVFHIAPADVPTELFTGRVEDFLRGTELEAGRYVRPRLFVAAQARAALVRPGGRIEYRTPQGFRWVTSWEPRFLASEPTLATDRRPITTSIFGAFLFREWRF